MTNTINAKLVFDERSQLGAFRLHMRHRYRFWLALRALLCAGLFIAAGFMIVNEGLTPYPILMVMVATFALLRPLIWKIMHSRNLRQLPGYGQTVLYTFSPDEIQIHGETKQASIQIEQLMEVVSHQQGLLLYHGKKAYTWIPREAFDSDQDFQEVSNWLT